MSKKYRNTKSLREPNNFESDAKNQNNQEENIVTVELAVVDDVLPVEKKTKNKTEKCKVECFIGGKAMVYFKGFGLQFKTEKTYKRNDTIIVGYTGDIGKPNFKSWIVE